MLFRSDFLHEGVFFIDRPSCLARATGRLLWRVSEKKYSSEAEEIASLDMEARDQYSSINFLGGYIEGTSIVNFGGRFLLSVVFGCGES